MNYYERHIGDYLKDTAHLSLLEHGVYTRLLDVYYTREGGIPSAEVARLIGARSRDEKAALAAVLAEFFVERDGLHTQDRADREVERFHGKQAKAKASADARWSAQRTQSDGNATASAKHGASADAPAMRTHSEGNAPRARSSPQTPDTSLHKEKPPAGVQGARRALKNCPSEFLVTPELQRWARESVPLVDIRAETAIFRATERKVGITDWPKAWQKWMLSEQKRHAEQAARDARRGPADTGYGFETPAQRAARERVAEISGGLASRKPPGPSGPSLPMELPLAERVD